MDSKIKKYFDDYASYHQTPGNMWCHCVGIPLLEIVVLGLLSKITFETPFPFSAAMVLLVLGNLWYLSLNFKLGVTMVFSTLIMLWVGSQFPQTVLWALFVLGWVIQYYGHIKYEKKSPAFYKNVLHLLIGPMYVQNYFLKFKIQ